ILVRGGTIVPLGPRLSHISDDHRFDRLQLAIWPPYPATCLLYDDDGRTRSYEHGAFSVTRIVAEGDDRRVVVHIAAAEGGFPGQAAARHVEIILCRVAAPVAVRVDARESAQWTYDAASSRAIIPVRCPTDRETVVEITWQS